MLIPNLLDEDYAKAIRNLVDNNSFPWYFYDNIVSGKKNEVSGFIHMLFFNTEVESTGFDFFKPLIKTFVDKAKDYNIIVKSLHRIQINLMVSQDLTNEKKTNNKHVDMNKECPGKFISFIYYIDDSDGDTIVYDDNNNEIERVTPKRNACLFFNSKNLHEGTPPIKSKKRMVINCILSIE